MPVITIDNKEYDTDKMSDDARNQLMSLQFTDQEIMRLQAQMALATYGFSAESAN